MTENNQNLISELRSKRYLNAPTENILSTVEIIDAINDIQRRIFSKVKIEKSFTIYTIKGKADYDFTEREFLTIKKIFTSWGGNFEIVDNTQWDNVKDATGNYPLYGTIFARKLKLVPAPDSDSLKIDFWGYQTNLIDPVDASGEIDIEIPDTLMLALKLGVVSEYDKKKYPEFLSELETQRTNLRVKETRNKEAYPNW